MSLYDEEISEDEDGDFRREYKEETWGKKIEGEDIIDGYKFKGKQAFRKAREELEKLMIRDSYYMIGNFVIKILDARSKGIELEADIEIKENGKDNRGLAVVKLYGPNKRKENTVTITKHKRSDIQFVTIMAEKVMKPLLKKIIDEPGFSKEAIETEREDKPFKCQNCEKAFKTRQGMKTHLTKMHKENEKTMNSQSTEEKVLMMDTESNEDEISLEERVSKEDEYFYSCSKCQNNFSRKYSLIQHSLKHKQTCSSIRLKGNKRSNQCKSCDYTSNNEQLLRRHKRDNHDILSASTSPPPKKTKVTQSTRKSVTEDMDIDPEETSEEVEMDYQETEQSIRSKLMDEKIKTREERINEEEKKYQEIKVIRENSRREIKENAVEKQKQEMKQKRQRKKDEKKRKRKEKEVSKPDFEKDKKNVPNIKPIPKNIAHLVNKGDKVYCVPGDGACGPNSISAHLFKDEVFGSKLRLKMNHFMVNHWDRKYKYKTQCSEGHPFSRKIGSGGKISFTNQNELLGFLEKSQDAAYMWTDSEDLIIVSDMFQIRIKVISTKGENDKNPNVYWVYPDEEMKQFAELKNVELLDMVLLHENDTHFNLIVSEDNDLVNEGSISFRTNIGPMDQKDTVNENDIGKKTFAEAVVSGRNFEDLNAEIKELKLALQKSKEKIVIIEKQYNDCEKQLIKTTEECTKFQSELQDLKAIMNLENKIKGTQDDINDGNCVEKTENPKEKREKELNCEDCDHKCTKESEMRNHKVLKHRKSCQICEQNFITDEALQNHMEKDHDNSPEGYTNEMNREEEFNCLECPFQGSEEIQLSKHVQLKHRIQCRNCEKSFNTKPSFMEHRKTEHYSLVAHCRKGLECTFFEKCWWKHGANGESFVIECYFCDISFPTRGEVMIHRKTKHAKTVKSCTKFKNQSCNRTEATCWFKHIDEENMDFRDRQKIPQKT